MLRLLYLIACLAPFAASADERPTRLNIPSRAPGTVGPLDWVFERVDAGSDEFGTEVRHERIASALQSWADRCRAVLLFVGPVLAESAPMYADSFRGTYPGPTTLRAVKASAGVQIERTPATLDDGEVESDRNAVDFDRWLLSQLGELGSPRKYAFKVFRIRDVADAGQSGGAVDVRVLFEADGERAASPRFRQLRVVFDLRWEMGEPIRLSRARVVSLERAALETRPFVDATAAAFGRTASYREQLSRGVDYWRRRIDAASGIDIYGHQGLAVGDYDSDGHDDVYVAQAAGLPNRLYRGRGDGTFEDTTSAAGVGVLDVTGGALFVDLDQDGDEDLVVVTGLGPLVFENKGDGAFRHGPDLRLDATAKDGASTMGAVAADFDRDGDLDLYVYSYIFWAGAGSFSNSSYPYPYHDANNGAPNFLLRNDGALRFTDVTKEAGLDINNRRFSLAASWCDYDDDGDADLYVANDFGRNNLYRNRGDGTFEDVARAAGVEDTGNGMSVTWCDEDGDGDMDLYVGNMWSSAGLRLAPQDEFSRASGADVALYRRMSRGNSLYRNRGDGTFEDVSIASGAYFGRWSWAVSVCRCRR